MATDFDLAEQADVPIDVVRAWLKRHGYGGKRGQRIKPAVERAFLDAYASDSPMTSTRSHSRVSPVATRRSAPLQRPKPQPKAPAQPSLLARDQAKRIADLQRELTETRAALQVAEAALARSVALPKPTPAPKAAEPVVVSVRTSLARQGLQGHHAIDAMRIALQQQPERVLTALSTNDPALFSRIQPVCAAVACRTVATFDGWHPIAVGAQACGVCRGSDNRRWFRLMAARLKRGRCARLLVVGGGPGSHTELRRLLRDATQLDVHIVDGSTSMDNRQAKALVLGVDVVVFWTSTMLPHAVSDPIREAARSAPRLIRAATPAGGKGIAMLCKTVITALDEQQGARR